MKSGLALIELATELERQSETKKDFVASTLVLEMTAEGELTLETETSSNEFPLTDNYHAQIATKLDIPTKYYNRMRKEAPELLATNVNEWFHNKPSRRMIRTLDGQARAFLSARKIFSSVLCAIFSSKPALDNVCF